MTTNYNKRGRACIIHMSDTEKVEGFFHKWGISSERTPDNKHLSVTKALVEIKESGMVIPVEPQLLQFTDLTE